MITTRDAQLRALKPRGQKTGYTAPREQGSARTAQLAAVVDPGQPLRLELPLRIYSEQNERLHWAAKNRRVKTQRNAVAATLAHYRAREWIEANRAAQRLHVHLVRIGKRRMDSDGVVAGFKAVRDAIAREFGIDDGSDRWQFTYDQRIAKQFSCEITIEAMQ